MKRSIKLIFFSIYRIFARIKTEVFSNFFISLGYFIKSESMFNTNGARNLDWDRLDLHKMLVTEVVKPDEPILFMEFGVYKGQTFKIWAENNKHSSSEFKGFDTFQGLPEDWGSIKKSSFSAQGKLPEIKDDRVQFFVGLIQDTLPGYCGKIEKGKRKVIHIDVDLYNATLITLIHLHPHLESGDIIIFDDFYTITKARHEYRAFLDYLELYKTVYKPLINCRNGHIVVEIS